MANKIIPLDDNVLIQMLNDNAERVTAGGIVVPPKPKSNQRDAGIGKVLAVGPGRTTEYGTRLEVTVKPGDMVLLPRSAGVEIEHEDGIATMRLLRSCELLGVVEESRIVGIA